MADVLASEQVAPEVKIKEKGDVVKLAKTWKLMVVTLEKVGLSFFGVLMF